MNEQTLEERRLALQSELDLQRTQVERNKLGQFSTPTELASDILSYSVDILPPEAPIRFLDPAIGTGAFYSALQATTEAGRVEAALGFEIDPHYALPAQRLWNMTPLRIRQEDFTTACAPDRNENRFNLVICNPPYVRHHHISSEEKARLRDLSEIACGIRITGLSGLYCHFLALTHRWMCKGGVAGWLIPGEFMDVNYGQAVKSYLLEKVSLLRIHRFEPSDVQFEDALVSSAVVFFRNSPPGKNHKVEFTLGGRLNNPLITRFVQAKALRSEKKWTRFPVTDVRSRYNGLILGDLFKIQRGLATGSNSFFILPPGEIEERGLPWDFFQPILPSPRYLDSDEIETDDKGDPVLTHRLYLLNCRLPEPDVRTRYPRLWAYLRNGIPQVSDRYLCRHRNPWYSQEVRPPSPIVCTYMGRKNKSNGAPFRFILNNSRATAANVYLLLYPKPVLRNLLEKDPNLIRKVWEILKGIDPEKLLGEGRVYGGGLYKLEPKELANAPLGSLAGILPEGLPKNPSQRSLFDDEAA